METSRSRTGQQRQRRRPDASALRASAMPHETAGDAVRLERLRAVAAQVLERSWTHVERQGMSDQSEFSSLAGLSPVRREDTGSWASSPATSRQRLRRRAIGASVLLRRSLSLWRSATRDGVARRHATAQRLLQEQLQKKDEELRVTVGALERAVAVAQEQLSVARSDFEKKIDAIARERDSLTTRCTQLEVAAKTSVVVAEDPALTQARSVLLAGQRKLEADREALESDRTKLRQLQMSLLDFSGRKELEHLPLEEALERTRRARIQDSRANYEKRLTHRDRLLSNLSVRVAWSQHRRLLERCVAAWWEEVATAQRRNVSAQRVMAALQQATKRRSMSSWMAMVQKSRRDALVHAHNELATALADLTAVRSSTPYTAAERQAADLQVREAIEEAEAAKRLQAAAQQELVACRARMLSTSTQIIAEKEARRHAVATRAMAALQTRSARVTLKCWADTAHKLARTRRLIARTRSRMAQSLLTRSFRAWVEHWRGPMVPLSHTATAQNDSDIASFARAANQAAAETSIQLLEEQLRVGAATAVDAEKKNERAILDLEMEVAAAREAVAAESSRFEQSTQELLIAKSALADATERHEEAQEQANSSIAVATKQRSTARKQVSKLKQEQQGLKLALKLAQTSRLKEKERHVALMTRRNLARAHQRLLRMVVRRWVQECWRGQLTRSEQLFSQLTLLAEAQSAAVGLLEDEADSAATTSLITDTERTKAMQRASQAWEIQKMGWSRRCVQMRVVSQSSLALHCVFGVWKYYLRVQMAKRAMKQSWLEHNKANSTRVASLELELESTRVKLEGLNLLGMDASKLDPDELMVLLVEAAEELAIANEAARSTAQRNDALLKQLKADTDRQLRKLSSSPQSPLKSLQRARSTQHETSDATDVPIAESNGTPGVLWPFHKPQSSGKLPFAESSMDDASSVGVSEESEMHHRHSAVSPRPARVLSGEGLGAAGIRMRPVQFTGVEMAAVAEVPPRAQSKPTLPQQTEEQKRRDEARLPAEGIPPDHAVETTLI